MLKLKIVLITLIVCVLTVASVSAGVGSQRLSDARMLALVGGGSTACDFADGFSDGLAVTALIAAVVPGGQSYAVGAGITAGVLKLGVGLFC